MLAAEVDRERCVAFGNGQYIEPDQGDFVHRLACTDELLDLGRVPAQPRGNARSPANRIIGRLR